jgi:2-oxoglutarate ferredoxin oxidoreductase subunit alpha
MSVEMSQGGQMIDDVKIANEGRLPIGFYGRSGGMVPAPKAIVEAAKEMLGGVK